MSAANKKTPREFQCRNGLWTRFEEMAHELECSVDYLINDAMKQYARQRGYTKELSDTGGAHKPVSPPLAPSSKQPPPLVKPSSSDRPPAEAQASASNQTSASNQPPPLISPTTGAKPPPIPTGAPPLPPGKSAGLSGLSPSAQTPKNAGPPTGPPPIPATEAPFGAPPPLPTSGVPAIPTAQVPAGPLTVPMTPGRVPPLPNTSTSPNTSTRRPPPPPSASMAPRPPLGMPPQPAPGAMPPGIPPLAPAGGVQSLTVHYQGQAYPVTKDRFIIGRGKSSSDLTIRDPNVSRQHALIEFSGGNFFMVDMGSTNGVEFNGQRVQRKTIQNGDIYRVCDHELYCSMS